MALSDDHIAEIMRDTWGCASIAPRYAEPFARAIEAEVRKADTELIRQMLEALERCTKHDDADYAAITAARARLGVPK